MSAIEFVVRDSAGAIQRGVVGGDIAPASFQVTENQDISLNLRPGQILGYARRGEALEITLIDGRVIVVEGFFSADGFPENRLLISADGVLQEVELVAGEGSVYYANYAAAEAFGKWSPDDALYFLDGPVEVADAAGAMAADAGATMAANTFGAGLAGLGGWGLGGAAAVAGGVAVLGDGDGGGGGPQPPTVTITDGTSGTGTTVNSDDHEDGVTIDGEGTPGADVSVTVDNTTETTVVGEDGNWSVTFDPADVPGGEYETDVTVVISNENGSSTVTDTLVVDTVATVTFDGAAVGGDGTVNGEEAAGTVTLTGTVEAGSTVVVTVGGNSYGATVDGTTWAVDLPPGALPGGEYDQSVSVTATDGHGNSATTSGTFHVDTVTSVTIDTSGAGGDGTVNGAEHAGGTVLMGTAQPGSSVVVTLGGASQTVTATQAGTWSTTFSSAEVPAGESTLVATAVATDAAGNTASASGTVVVDTLVNDLTQTEVAGGADAVVNGVEQGQPITFGGTVEAGSTVYVTMAGTTVQAAVTGTSWTATFPAGTLPDGEYETAMTVTATDAAGNTASLTETVAVDTLVNTLTQNTPVEGDDMVNAAEAADGITLTGSVEAGSSVMVTLSANGVVTTRAASVDANGGWSVDFAPGEIPGGEYDAQVSIVATDAAGNTASLTDTLAIDTVAPEAPIIASYSQGASGVRDIGAQLTDNSTKVLELDSDGNLNALGYDVTEDTTWNEVVFDFDAPIPTGSHLVVQNTDAAGNEASTLFVLEEPNTNVVDLSAPGLGEVNIGAIDLQFADDSELTLTAEIVAGLSDSTDTLVVHGGAGDQVVMAGAERDDAASGEVINGRAYDVYTIGDDGATVYVDEDISVTI